jgi:hypothetical protein
MRLDHVSYVASHDQISDVVNRIGSQIGTAFVDGGIHPKFGTRNFTAPLLNGQYIEVVCPMDHPATDTTPFGKAVKSKAEEGGGWLAWVVAVKNIKDIEEKIGRNAVEGSRRRPDGTELKWKQVGLLDTINNSKQPYFIEWLTPNHPSKDGKAVVKINQIELATENDEGIEILDLQLINPIQPFSFTQPLLSTDRYSIKLISFVSGNNYISIE